jgi:hypothetical protein
MTEVVTNELLLEHLRRILDRLNRLETGQRSILDKLRAHRHLIAGALSAQTAHETRTASFEHRLDRIEARLELREAD